MQTFAQYEVRFVQAPDTTRTDTLLTAYVWVLTYLLSDLSHCCLNWQRGVGAKGEELLDQNAALFNTGETIFKVNLRG